MNSKFILSIIIEQCLILCILIIHLSGFMNVSQIPNLEKNSSSFNIEKLIENTNHYYNYKNEPLGKKTVLLIIDALRADHLVSSQSSLMKYSTELLENKKGIGYLLKTASPTVTLPRIKSIVTGSIPSFMDVIFNFAAKEIYDENIVSSAHKKALRINFFGDETWLKLYPKTFTQYDAVTSFFVSDYTEVDNNVTRHLPNILSSNDYDFLILHYLGLDHIGHLEGPKSSLIPPKLREMDRIVKMIHENLKNKGEPYLFLVCGDHGMSDIGGHGGDSHSEIWTSAMVMSHLLDNPTAFSSGSSPHRIRSQVDLSSTLALHLGVDIPLKNVGFPLFELLENIPLEKQLVAHYRVAKQLMHLARYNKDLSSLGEVESMYANALKLHHESVIPDSISIESANKALSHYKEFELVISTMLTENMESYDMVLLLASSIIIILICLPTVVWTLFLSTDITSPIYEKKMLYLTIVGGVILFVFNIVGLAFISPVSYIIFVLFIYGVCNLFSFAKCFTADFQMKVSSWNIVKLFIIIGVILYPFSLLATSFVEEEHFVFYFVISMIYFTLLLRVTLNCLQYKFFSDSSNREKRHEVVANSHILKFHYPMSVPSLYNADIALHFLMSKKKEQGIILSDGTNDKRFVSNFIIVFFSWCLFRLLRSFNATGDKWKDVIHLNDILRDSDGNELLICILIGLGIVLLLYRQFSPLLIILMLTGIFGRHFPFVDKGVKSGLLESHFVYLGLFIFIFYNSVKVFYYNKIYIKKHEYNDLLVGTNLVLYMLQIFETFFALLFLLLQRPENVLVTSLSLLHMHLIIPLLIQNWETFGLTRMQIYIIALWLGQASFFVHGNSNSLSTVQINSGFVGISSYKPVLHGVLIACHTFGSKFLVLLHTLVVILTRKSDILRVYMCIRCWWMLQLLTLTVYVINVTLQRHHLFIWSVFAPKLLYEECNFLCLMILTIIVYLFIKIANFVSK